jgi:hypothetical protein
MISQAYIQCLSQIFAKTHRNMTDTADKLMDPSIRRLFEGKNFVFVSTLMRDGTPQITPTWVDLEEDGGHILVNTATGRVKQKKRIPQS